MNNLLEMMRSRAQPKMDELRQRKNKQAPQQMPPMQQPAAPQMPMGYQRQDPQQRTALLQAMAARARGGV